MAWVGGVAEGFPYTVGQKGDRQRHGEEDYALLQ